MARNDQASQAANHVAAFCGALKELEKLPEDRTAWRKSLFTALTDLSLSELHAYQGRRKSSRRVSKTCRFFAWLLGTVGAAVPLLEPILADHAPQHFLSWGFIALGCAASLLLFDSSFAGTGAHQRYTATLLKLEHLLLVFALEWQKRSLDLGNEPNPAADKELLDHSIAYLNELHQIMGAETASWQEDLTRALTDLKGRVSGGARPTG